ncbi:MAG TPA: pyridoxamine 5'-phosphate oxidase family protein [Symbiobacteriaceae bacterium]|nr:pyridoxamine 5'-phosphate oxidase family protein [Symbiobacteriaceae bacterium]
MSKHLGNRMPPELLQKLEKGSLYRPGGLGLAVLTVDEAGWPHAAMAPGCVAVRPDVVWVALGGSSRSLQNVVRSGQVTLQIAGPDTLYYVKGRATVVRPEMQVMTQEAALRVEITEVLDDLESFVTVTGGIGYRYRMMHDDFVQVIGALLDELYALATTEEG